jgi:agmatinase
MFTRPDRSFLDQPIAGTGDLRAGDAVVFGAGFGTPYPAKGEVGYALGTSSSLAPAAVRAAVNQSSTDIGHYDFDLGGPLLPPDRRLVDLGDLVEAANGEGNRAAIEATARAILSAQALPVMIGGDDSVPIPFLRAFSGEGPVDVLQIDAHIDWRDSLGGVRDGYSSTMRRASELPFVRSITQVGMRGVGSARPEEVADALAWGARLVTVREARAMGMATLARSLPGEGRLVIQIDADALDPSVCPAVNAPTPGGFRFEELSELLRAAIAKRGLAGLSVVELVPGQDPFGHSANAVGRLICNAVGFALRSPGD